MTKLRMHILMLLSFLFVGVAGISETIADVSLPPDHSDATFDSEVRGLRKMRPVGDIEGQGIHFEALEAEGLIKWDHAHQRWDLVDRNVILIFNGDFMRRGPYGARAVEFVLDLLNRYSDNVRVSIGNHDGVALSLVAIKAEIEAGLNVRYSPWLQKSGRQANLASQILFWADEMAIRERVDNYWLEQVILKRGANKKDAHSPLEQEFYEEVEVNGKKVRRISYQALNRVIPEAEMAQGFYDFHRPGGSPNGVWKVLEKGTLAGVFHGKDTNGRPTVIWYSHSGMVSRSSLGVVPGEEGRYVKIGDGVLKQNHAEGLHHGLTKQEYFSRWLKAVNSGFKDGQLGELRVLLEKFNALLEKPSTPENIAERADLFRRMNNLEVIHNLDAGWTAKYGLQYRSDSLVYPPPRAFGADNLPALPDPAELAALIAVEIEMMIGGHKPIGDVAFASMGVDPATGRALWSVFHDTSYSPVEGTNRVTIWENGAIRIIGTTRDGKTIVFERPGKETIAKWEKEVAPWRQKIQAAKDNAKPGESPPKIELPEDIKMKLTRLDRYSRLGLVAGGRLIVGFQMVTEKDGSRHVDYDRYITASQDKKYQISYEETSVYGLMEFEKTGRLQQAQSDLRTMMKKAESEKSEILRQSGKEILDVRGFIKALNRAVVYFHSGPSANYSKVLNDSVAKKYIDTKSLPAFRQHLLAIPAHEKAVIIVGGTAPGWEAEKTKIAVEVNEIRIKEGKSPIRVIGAAALNFNPGEMDPNIKEFFLIPGTFYWADLLGKLLNNFVLKSRALAIHLNFGGGGAAVTDQLHETLEIGLKDRRVTMTLEKGITAAPNDPTHANRGASDRLADLLEDGRLAPEGRFVSTVQADVENSRAFYRNYFGPESIFVSISKLAEKVLPFVRPRLDKPRENILQRDSHIREAMMCRKLFGT